MRESETPPEMLDWPADDSSDSFVMVSTTTGEGSKRGRFFAALTLAMLVGVVLLASSASWVPTVQRQWTRIFPPPPYTGAITVVQEQNEATLWGLRADSGKPQWMYRPISLDSSPLLVGDIVVAVELGGLVGIRIADGHVLWHVKTPQDHALAVLLGYDPQHIIAWFPSLGDQSRSEFQAVDVHTGALGWQTQSNGFPLLPTQGKDILFCSSVQLANGTTAGIISAFDSATGALHWQTPEVLINVQQGSNCFATTSFAYIEQTSATTHELWEFDLNGGTQRWHHTLSSSIAFNDNQRFYTTNWFFDQPQTDTPVLTAFDAVSGVPLWHRIGKFASLWPVMVNGTVLTLKSATGIAGVDVRTGTILWQFDPLGDTLDSWFVTSGEGTTLYYLNASHLYEMDVLTGRVIWDHATTVSKDNSVGRDLVYRNHRLYLANAGTFTVFDAANGHVLWQATKPYFTIQ